MGVPSDLCGGFTMLSKKSFKTTLWELEMRVLKQLYKAIKLERQLLLIQGFVSI